MSQHLFGRTPRRMAAAILALVSFFCAMTAWADEPPTELRVAVSLSNEAQASTGISLFFKLAPRMRGSSGLPGLRAIHMSGGLGRLTLRRIPSCRPTAESQTSGCSSPAIGAGRIVAIRQFEAAGATPIKLHGIVRLYSGGQRGQSSKLYAWASFGPGAEGIGGSFVISITLKRRGPARSELTATLPELEGSRFAVKELLLSVRRDVRVKGRSIAVTSVDCPEGSDGLVNTEATFFYYSDPVAATATPSCAG